MKNECNLVKDLLFNYNEGTLSDTSKEIVEEHLKKCESCRNFFEKIQKQNSNDIDFLKKIRKKINTKNFLIGIISIILIILILFCISFYISNTKKVSILNGLRNKAEMFNTLSNYSYTVTSIYNDSKSFDEYFYKDKAFYSSHKTSWNDGKEIIEYAYCDGINDIIYVETNGIKSISINKENYISIGGIIPDKISALGKSLYYSDIQSIQEYSEDGKDYYLITTKLNNIEYTVEKDTGIAIKVKDKYITYEMSYVIGNVTDDDIIKINKNMTVKDWLEKQ